VIDEEVQAKTDGHQLVAIIHEKLEAL